MVWSNSARRVASARSWVSISRPRKTAWLPRTMPALASPPSPVLLKVVSCGAITCLRRTRRERVTFAGRQRCWFPLHAQKVQRFRQESSEMVGSVIAALDRERVKKPSPDAAWRVEVDRATPAEWSDMLDLFDDANIYQTRSYGAVRWGRKNLSHLVLKRNDEVVGIAQLRIVRPTRLKFGMAYLRWGPICQRRGSDLDPEVVARMAEALYQEYVIKERLLLQILPNAFVGTARAEMFRTAFSNFALEPPTPANLYRTFVVDLSLSLSELRKKLDPKWRNKLAGAEKNGLTVRAGRTADQYRTFCEMYRQMRNRKTFDTTVDVEEFDRIQQDLPEDQRMQILIGEQRGTPVAGVVVSAMGHSAIYLLGATSD